MEPHVCPSDKPTTEPDLDTESDGEGIVGEQGACFNVKTGDLEEYLGPGCLSWHTAGSASLVCAETLRQNYRGRVVMVAWDDLLPYDKTEQGTDGF
ncbi:hypothetical protein AAFF_G00255880 [Aldrovandia affinis]|uniref:Uncharacterized protein n=1 Tax=Aldrovandia affinis TaxID=143900 RepID=A0AAD7W2T3_9TELE|nr:hypothetical protein AAFF_G00255880 [Aldrovandia affinis]